jgi:PAS domain S-box-containing protein
MITSKNIFNTSEPAFAVDVNGQIVTWNQEAERAFGFEESEALGQRCWKLLQGQDIFGNESCCEGCPIRTAAFHNKPINRFQIDFQTAAHGQNRFMVSTMTLRDGSGEEVLVHMCRPYADVIGHSVTSHNTNLPVPNTNNRILTPREIEVLSHLHKGKSVTEMAALMRISDKTVLNHTQHVLFKLNVHNRLEAVTLGRKLGLI